MACGAVLTGPLIAAGFVWAGSQEEVSIKSRRHIYGGDGHNKISANRLTRPPHPDEAARAEDRRRDLLSA
jgi:hypothetical protein